MVTVLSTFRLSSIKKKKRNSLRTLEAHDFCVHCVFSSMTIHHGIRTFMFLLVIIKTTFVLRLQIEKPLSYKSHNPNLNALGSSSDRVFSLSFFRTYS